MIKYKLYKLDGEMYAIPLDKYDEFDSLAESYFSDLCAGLISHNEHDRFVEDAIINCGGKGFDIDYDDYYVIMNKGGDSFDGVLEIPLIGERKTTSGLESCSIWWG